MAFGFGFGLTRGGSTGGPFATAALDLNFLGGTLDSKVTFTRTGSVATYVNSSGYITTAGANTARFDYDPATLALRGLLIEQSATNSLLYSEDFSNAVWNTRWGGTATITNNDATVRAPDGTQTVDKVVATSGGSGVGYAISLTANTTYTFSAWVYSPDDSVRMVFATSTSPGTDVATINVLKNTSLTRYSVTYTPTVTQTYYVGVADNYALQTFYIWGAQLEVGSFPTSYIPTTTATVTRGTDVAVLSGTNFSSWFSSTAGTFYAEGAPITATPAAYSFIAEGYTGSVAGTFTIGTTGTNTFGLNARIGGAGANTNESIPLTFTAGGVIKGSVSYDSTPTNGLVLNGSVITASTISTAATATNLYIGSRGGSTNAWNGWVRRVSFFNSKLTNAQMQTLTT